MSQKNLQLKTDSELVKAVKSQADSESFKEVCRRYENIFYKICQKYVGPLTMSGVDPQDIFDEKTNIIYHCVSTYEPKKKTKLGTWIGNYARYLCLNSINARKFIMQVTDADLKQRIEEGQISQEFASNKNPQEDFNYILNLLEQLKDPRIIEIFRYRYFGQKRIIWAQIANNLHNRGLELLKRKVKSDHISDIL
jgi:DNA-directed RNA polymerase specialized sigma24 family protein